MTVKSLQIASIKYILEEVRWTTEIFIRKAMWYKVKRGPLGFMYNFRSWKGERELVDYGTSYTHMAYFGDGLDSIRRR